jgi:sugar phosphate isomerase/epimerase
MTKPSLRRDLNIITGLGLPAWSAGPQGDFAAIIAAAKAAGYAGVQHFIPQQVIEAGMAATGMGRVLAPEQADQIAAQHKAIGCEATTLHVGTGLESDAEMDRLIGAVLNASAKHDYPLYVETHRATVTQDIRRTIDLVERFPELRFNADLSHYYCGHEMPYGDIEAKFEALAPVFARVRFMHGRIADTGAAQASLEQDDNRPFVQHFRTMWRACFSGYKRSGETHRPFIFAVELLPYKLTQGDQTYWLYYARQAPGPDGVVADESDRWLQADLLWRIAEEEFAAA